MSRLRQFLACLLTILLISPVVGRAQQPAPLAPQQSPPNQSPPLRPSPVPPGPLNIYVLEGQNAVNSIPSKTAISPVIEVRDSNDRPVENAEVSFELPASGPGGFFANKQLIATTRTNANGQATAFLTPNDESGSFVISVKATFSGLAGSVQIRQTNSKSSLTSDGRARPKPAWYKRKLTWILIGAAAGGVVGIIATRGSSKPTVSVSPGGVSIGGPR